MHAAQLAAHYLKYRFRSLHPFEVQAVLLNACNLKCDYCRCPDMPTALMTTAQWTAAVQGLAAVGTRRIKFQGGEPTLRKDFNAIAAAAKAAGLVTAVVTNGTIIADQPALLEHLDEVVVSLDALTATRHDAYRGAGTHTAALRTLAIAAGCGRRTYVNMVVHRDTLEELEPMLAFCEQHGYKLNAQAVMFGHEYQDSTAVALRLPEATERAMYEQLAAWKRAGRALMFAASSYDRTAAWPDYTVLATAAPGVSSCMAGRFYIHLDANGDIHPCGLHTGTFRPKNLLRDGLEAALHNAARHDCRDCSLAYLNERKAVFGLRPAALLEVIRRA
ncbi:MAG: radical SAM protein [Vicinamibacterales bacterium]